MGWTINESLVILARDGVYRLYPISMTGQVGSVIQSNTTKTSSLSYTQHSLAHDVQDATILDARIYENGMVILLSTHQYLHVKGFPESDTLSDSSPFSSSFIASQNPTKSAHLNSSAHTPGSSNDVDPASAAAAAGQYGYGKGRVERFAEVAFDRSPNCWCILTPDQSTSRQVEILAGYGEAVISIDQLDVQDQVGSFSFFALFT
jgi:hypothetical protein